jgi:hypothetical protein
VGHAEARTLQFLRPAVTETLYEKFSNCLISPGHPTHQCEVVVELRAQVKVTHRYHLLRADEKQHHDACLDMIAKAGETTRFGTLYLIDDDYIKVGVADQRQIANRHGNLQTGNPRPIRLITLCFFYSREVALVVETELKRRHSERRAGGGTEWFNVSQEELRRDVIAVAHGLALNQIWATAGGAEHIRPELANYFYGLLMFDMVEGKLRQSWDFTPTITDLGSSEIVLESSSQPTISLDDRSETKRGRWDQLRRLIPL